MKDVSFEINVGHEMEKEKRGQGQVSIENDAEEYKAKTVGESEVGQHAPLIESKKEQGSWDTKKFIQYALQYIQCCYLIRHVC